MTIDCTALLSRWGGVGWACRSCASPTCPPQPLPRGRGVFAFSAPLLPPAHAERVRDLGAVPGRPLEPADRLRHRRRPGRHRRRQPRIPDPGDEGVSGRMGVQLPPGVSPGAEERRRGDHHRRPARLRQARPAHRRHRLDHRQGQVPARRGADHGAAVRRRRPDLRDGAGQSRGRRAGHFGQGWLAADRQRPHRRPHRRRRERRTRGRRPASTAPRCSATTCSTPIS